MQESRDSLGLHLEGSIIVVDEAHNLVDAVNAAHCAEVSISQLNAAEAQLSNYFERFRTRLAAGELQMVVLWLDKHAVCGNPSDQIRHVHRLP